MREIKLPAGRWVYDEKAQLGPAGGFGAVYAGRGEKGEPVAVKQLRSAYQAREMAIADYLLGHGLAHVIPILDAGFDADAGTNFIVMPVAETSLQKRIGTQGPVGELEALEILSAIAAGLDEIGDIIHRDLKPGNVLLHDGVWKLADLGLARFAEATTSRNTMREALTPDYAAPEQWRGERPTKATDVYALGGIMHALLRGAPPFAGPELADFAHQHQFVAPPALDATPHLRRLAAACLSKSPELRPSVQSLRKQLETARAGTAEGPAFRLAAAARAVELAERQREEKLVRQRELERLRRIAEEAGDQLRDIFSELEAAIVREAPNAKVEWSYDRRGMRVSLGQASLQCRVDDTMFFPQSPDEIVVPFNNNGKGAGSQKWTIFRHGTISANSALSGGRSASLWFGQLIESDLFRWWEVSYVLRKRGAKTGLGPCGLYGLERYNNLIEREVEGYRVAQNPIPITPDFIGNVIERWIDLFAQAATANDRASVERLFPSKFSLKPIGPEFRLDSPYRGAITASS